MGRQIPKNVRQIGNVSDSSKIYIEDYVDIFLNQLCEKASEKSLGAFLVGEIVQEEEVDYIYVNGAIHMQELKTKGKDYIIEESVWKNACETCKEFFGDAEILGWVIAGGAEPVEMNHNIQKMHQKYFPREKSIFMNKDSREKEEKLFIYKFREMMEAKGHYIYYEKNEEMQDYMISCRKSAGMTPSETIDDQAAKNFRSIIQEKIEKKEQKPRFRFSYVVGIFLLLLVVGAGVTLRDRYEKIQNANEDSKEVQEVVSNDREILETNGAVLEVETPDEEEETSNDVTVSEEPLDALEENPEESEETSGLQMEEVYVVKKGDTLASISKNVYGDISYVSAICELNGLADGNLIMIGQKLLLP